ncbi:MAG: Murein DD-endopeptidase MepM [bacterium ADurb.Bin400]|nr:MAG: Murein DD-endopeptidase MepM [bacterium ADurb.Bin400]
MTNNFEAEPPSCNDARKTKPFDIWGKIKYHYQRIAGLLLKTPTSSITNGAVSLKSVQIKSFVAVINMRHICDIKSISINSTQYAHFALVLLASMVVAVNLKDRSSAEAFYSNLIQIDPLTEYSVAESIDYYTPLIEADDQLVGKAMAAAESSDGFVSPIGSVTTHITQREEPLPDNTSETIHYTIRDGDTLTGIGWKFEVKIATLKYINDIDNVNMLKPGLVIKVPPRGYEVPASAIAKKEKERQTKLAAANRNTVTRNVSSARASSISSSSSVGYGRLIIPISHNGVSQGYSRRHTGIDYRANIGTPIVSADGGVVISITSGWSGGYGTQVLVSHGGGIVTRYAHLSRVLVEVGERVNQGQVIARSGNTGRSTGPHLHFEKIVNGRPVSPF